MSRPFLFITVVLWAAAVAAGLRVVWTYDNTPGSAGVVSGAWPAATALSRSPRQYTLVLAAHPQCPCTHASIGELAQILARCPGRVYATVLFYRPADAPAGWERTDLWERASRLGVRLVADRDGVEARRFGAATSGQVALFDPRGRLVYSGGITGSRGHAGENDGRRAIEDLLLQGHADRATGLVYGCPLSATPGRISTCQSQR